MQKSEDKEGTSSFVTVRTFGADGESGEEEEYAGGGGVGAPFAYRPAPDVFALSPPQGPEGGGVEVRVLGEGFARTPHLACRFGAAGGGAVVPATFATETMVSCVAPPALSVNTLVINPDFVTQMG